MTNPKLNTDNYDTHAHGRSKYVNESLAHRQIQINWTFEK
jgi:hypothetical protein